MLRFTYINCKCGSALRTHQTTPSTCCHFFPNELLFKQAVVMLHLVLSKDSDMNCLHINEEYYMTICSVALGSLGLYYDILLFHVNIIHFHT